MKTRADDDQETVRRLSARAIGGDGDALASLFAGYHHAIRGMLALRGCSIDEVDEIESEAYLHSLRGIQRAKPRDVRSWILGVVYKRFLRHLRGASTRRKTLDQHRSIRASEWERYLRERVSRQENIDRTEVVAKAFQRLSRSEQDLLSMRYVDGMEPVDIAKALRIRRSALDMRVSRAYKRLRDAYSIVMRESV